MCHVLIVSPDVKLRAYLLRVLEKYFANVILLPEGDSPLAGLAIAAKTKPELLILDLGLDKAQAFHVQAEMRQSHPNLRTILIDSEADYRRAQQAIRLGAIDYLDQHFTEEEILNSIHRAIISLNQVSLLNHRQSEAVPTQNEMILPMIEYIHQNFKADLTLDVLSAFMHLNKNYLSQLFKKEVGLSFVVYLNKYRIEQAKLRLRTTTAPLAEIAYEVGYSDPTYFSRIFKKYTEMTPNYYRQTYVGAILPVCSARKPALIN